MFYFAGINLKQRQGAQRGRELLLLKGSRCCGIAFAWVPTEESLQSQAACPLEEPSGQLPSITRLA